MEIVRQLAVECSGLRGSVGLFECEVGKGVCRTLGIRQLAEDLGTVQSLAPAIRELLVQSVPARAAVVSSSEFDSNTPNAAPVKWISITSGPGSFTGLRVGLATAKMLGMAWGIPLAGVDTLEVLAHQFLRSASCPPGSFIVPVLNAFRKQVFSAAWRVKHDGTMTRLCPSQVVDAPVWQREPLASLGVGSQVSNAVGEGAPRCFVLGPGLHTYPLVETAMMSCATEAAWAPGVEALGELGLAKFVGSDLESAANLLPNYIRASAAEEKAKSR